MVIIPALVVLGAAARISTGGGAHNAGLPVRNVGASAAYARPVLLSLDSGPIVVWQPSNGVAPLVVSDLATGTPPHALLTYPGLSLEAWNALSAGAGTFHVVWRSQEGTIYSALVDAHGQTLRGPIGLTLPTNAQFQVVAMPGREALVLALAPDESRLTAVLIDAEGRPRPAGSRAASGLQTFTAQLDTKQTLHLIWIAPDSSGTAVLNYVAMDLDSFMADEPAPPQRLASIELATTDTVTSLDFGLDLAYGYVMVGITTAGRPDAERVLVASFPLSDPTASTISSLALPHNLPAWDSAAPPAFDPATTDPATLRWPRFATRQAGQQAPIVAAVAEQTPAGWRPVLLSFDAGRIAAAGTVTAAAVDGSPIAILLDQGGAPWLAWTQLHGIESRLMVAGNALAAPDSAPDLSTTFLAGLAGIPLAVLWLVLPTFLVTTTPNHPGAALWLAASLYGATKLVIPTPLLAHGPPLALAMGLTGPDPALLAAITLLLIALVAATVYRIAHRVHLPTWASWLAYAGIDAALTWLAFGANTVPH